MKYYKITDPASYQDTFYEENKLIYTDRNLPMKTWLRDDNNYIHTFGSMDTIQCGVGNYSICSDFLVEYQYETIYLHFGLIALGTTYSVVENKLVDTYCPSSFVSIEKASGGVNCWKSDVQFKGTELSIEYHYLQEKLFPFLGYDKDALHFLAENIRYLHLPDEMIELLQKIERLILSNSMTQPLLLSITLEMISHLLHPKNQPLFNYQEVNYTKELVIGQRTVRLTKQEIQSIIQIHDGIRQDATTFHTIYELSQNYKIGEQKLKYGFREMYQISIWDYANEIRMNLAVHLLSQDSLNIQEISQKIGYQSQAAFINMFKKWSGITPGQFRLQMRNSKKLE